jgi:hypothetical protein
MRTASTVTDVPISQLWHIECRPTWSTHGSGAVPKVSPFEAFDLGGVLDRFRGIYRAVNRLDVVLQTAKSSLR